MPKATPELAAKFKDDDEAWQVLKLAGWKENNGMLEAPADNYRPTGREADAVDYLVDEWDWWW